MQYNHTTLHNNTLRLYHCLIHISPIQVKLFFFRTNSFCFCWITFIITFDTRIRCTKKWHLHQLKTHTNTPYFPHWFIQENNSFRFYSFFRKDLCCNSLCKKVFKIVYLILLMFELIKHKKWYTFRISGSMTNVLCCW